MTSQSLKRTVVVTELGSTKIVDLVDKIIELTETNIELKEINRLLCRDLDEAQRSIEKLQGISV